MSETDLPNDYAPTADDAKEVASLTQNQSESPGGLDPAAVSPKADFYRSDDAPQSATVPPPSTADDLPTGPPPPAAEAKDSLGDLPDGQPDATTVPLPNTKKYDAELDIGTSPKSGRASTGLSESDQIQMAEDIEPMDPTRNTISAEFAFVNMINNAGSHVYKQGEGIRYGLMLGRMLFLNRPSVQDELTLEAGAFTYTVPGYSDPTDSFTVIPLTFDLKYTILTSETFGIFFYGGEEFNLLGSSTITGLENSTSTPTGTVAQNIITNLTTPRVAVGAGLVFRLGPGWEARAQFGAEMIAMGLSIRF